MLFSLFWWVSNWGPQQDEDFNSNSEAGPSLWALDEMVPPEVVCILQVCQGSEARFHVGGLLEQTAVLKRNHQALV